MNAEIPIGPDFFLLPERDIQPRRAPVPDEVRAILEALSSSRSIEVRFPGEPIYSEGEWVGMGEQRVIHPGEAEPVEGYWVFDDTSVSTEAPHDPCD